MGVGELLPYAAPPRLHAPAEACPIPKSLKKARKVNWVGTAVFAIFIAAFAFYIGIRATKTLGLGGLLW